VKTKMIIIMNYRFGEKALTALKLEEHVLT